MFRDSLGPSVFGVFKGVSRLAVSKPVGSLSHVGECPIGGRRVPGPGLLPCLAETRGPQPGRTVLFPFEASAGPRPHPRLML